MGKIDKNAKIAVLCGGLSNERDVSLRSGKNVFEALKRLGYKNAVLVDVDENIAQKLKEEKIEVAYNALHGKYGEDGCVQGILEILKIKYTGCGVLSSSVCMNKFYTKKMLENTDIPLIKSIYVSKKDNVKQECKKLKYPLILKPVCEGSSIGMYKVNSENEIEELAKKSFEYADNILIEEYLVGKCATVGVLDGEKETFATEILEIRPKTEWYDYEAKYTAGMTEFILPAEISKELTEKIKKYAIKAHKACNCSGVSRVDFHIVGDIPYVLEINTSPGMTDLSDLPAQANAGGINYDNLVQLILNSAGLNK